MDAVVDASDLPPYFDLILPTLVAVDALGGSAKASEITSRLVEDLAPTEAELAVTYPTRDKSVLLDRMDWARSYAKLGGALESPKRGLFLLAPFGKEMLRLPKAEASERLLEMDRLVRSRRRGAAAASPGQPRDEDLEPGEATAENGEDVVFEDEASESQGDWREVLLHRLHALTPNGFEEFVLYLLRTYGLELDRVGGPGDEGIDGIGIAPISAVLSSRVAVQVKRYDPAGRSIGRETVALFQRDAQTKGAERAILVTLGKFSEPARRAAIATTPTVDLIDGQKLCDLILEQEVGVRLLPRVDESWFDRFD